MKKIALIFCGIFFIAGCRKVDDTMVVFWLWNHEYKVPIIKDAFNSYFPFPHTITIIRYGNGDGELKVKNTETHDVTYTRPGGWYQDSNNGCWYWNPATTVTETVTSNQVLTYHFGWDRYFENSHIRLTFVEEDAQKNNTNPDLVKSLNGKYEIKGLWTEHGSGLIGEFRLTKENGEKIVADLR